MKNAEDFLKIKSLFQLGDLSTETPHPKTVNLSQLAQNDVNRGLSILREVDLDVLKKMLSLKSYFMPIFKAVDDTLKSGDRIFFVGCGATGRLSLSLEFLWRRGHPQNEQVFSLMAGGDVALVHSLEGFEDYPEYGSRHLRQLGFRENDLLIGSTEGGETPYVIGAVEDAALISKRHPLFLYCNPTDLLKEKVERSRRVLSHPKVESFCLETGPMALTGSTRMQASTVLMLVLGLALEYRSEVDRAFDALESWIERLEGQDPRVFAPLVEAEAETYLNGDYTCYSVDDFAITVFTDTTERAPTFNLAPFDNPKHLTDRHSLTYISIPSAADAKTAWNKLLARTPRPLEWPEVHAKATSEYLYTFDFGSKAIEFRKNLVPSARHFLFEVISGSDHIQCLFRGQNLSIPMAMNPLFSHLTLKMCLNMHSTLVMGRLHRFEGNLMTWVYPSNGKLVDRAARYTQILLAQRGIKNVSYDDIVRAQFRAKENLSPRESIVHKSIELLLSERTQPLESRGQRSP